MYQLLHSFDDISNVQNTGKARLEVLEVTLQNNIIISTWR